jgi:hypothetical protein
MSDKAKWEPRKLSQAELVAEAKERFGDDPKAYAFLCPKCEDVATIADFIDVGEPDAAGQHCIGRNLGALKVLPDEWQGRGCDWTAYGLFGGPWTVVMPDGREVHSFPLADKAVAS